MKRILVLFAAAMLCASPALAAGHQGQGASSIKNSVNDTKVTGSNVVNMGKENTATVGGMKASNGGKIENSVNKTTVSGSNIVNMGEKNKTEIGVMEAK